MIAKFNNVQDAENYEASVHTYLQQFPKYIAERWANVIEFESSFYVPIHPSVVVQTQHELVTTIPYPESEEL